MRFYNACILTIDIIYDTQLRICQSAFPYCPIYIKSVFFKESNLTNLVDLTKSPPDVPHFDVFSYFYSHFGGLYPCESLSILQGTSSPYLN